MNKYEVVIGLEVHAQLRTQSKMFCGCDNMSVDVDPNMNICPVCLGMPGMLPVANAQAIEWTYLLGSALGAKVADKWNFERKNYFYPDLPKAYQITSSTTPPVLGGHVDIDIEGKVSRVHIHHIHLEEDAGKLVHPQGVKYSLVDLNRAGTPLVEIVSEPDMHSPREASVFLSDLRAILRYLGISDANMEQGNLRCDANISLRLTGEKKLGTKVEIKNMNSFKMIERALDYEILRQTEMLENGERLVQETRGWDDTRGVTTGQRSKEEANDYRYFPEPDLPPFVVGNVSIELPELPKAKLKRFEAEYGLSFADAEQLTSDLEMAHFFEKSVLGLSDETLESDELKRASAKKIANWIIGELIGRMNKFSVQLADVKIEPQHISELVGLIDSGVISSKQAKDVFDIMFEYGTVPVQIVKEKGLGQISNTDELVKIVDAVLSANEQSVADFMAGKQQSFGYLMGQVMTATKGQANPQVVNKLLKEKLS